MKKFILSKKKQIVIFGALLVFMTCYVIFHDGNTFHEDIDLTRHSVLTNLTQIFEKQDQNTKELQSKNSALLKKNINKETLNVNSEKMDKIENARNELNYAKSESILPKKLPNLIKKEVLSKPVVDAEKDDLTRNNIDIAGDGGERDMIKKHIQNTLEEALKEDKGTGCDIPKTDPFAKEVMQFDKIYPPVTCDGKDWVKCYLSSCKLEPTILDTIKDIQCTYRDIIFESDYQHRLGPETILSGNKEYKLKRSDHVEISCKGSRESQSLFSSSSERWGGHAVAFRPVPVKTPPVGRERTYNVLIFGFDSTAKNGFIRKMPKSYAFIKDELKATVLNGYNIVGDGTPASLFPILTGKTELELPECRKSIKNSGHLDSMPFIFYKLKEDGYRTVYFEDMPDIGTFQYRFNGFLRQPADHYLRDFYLEAAKNKKKFGIQYKPYCIGDTPQYQLMMNLTDQFFQLDGKKYAFTFIADITHDNFNMISTADDAFVEFLKGLLQRGVLKNTLLMIMGDHGPRYANVRETLQGKLEERLPLMAIRLPDDMLTQRPDAQKALEQNADVLTTPHDIYATVLDAIDMKEHWNSYKVKGADLTRSLTLLEPVAKNRSCSEAGIEPHWCACLRWQKVDEGDSMHERTALALLDYINSMTEIARSKCAIRTLKSIEWVMRKVPNKKVLLFQGAKDHDGYIGKFAKTTNIDKEVFQIKITVGPANGAYEAAVTHNIKEDKFVINPREISRINAYNKEPACISEVYPHLNPYCYCINVAEDSMSNSQS